MYGYKDKRLITKVRLMTYLIPFALSLALGLLLSLDVVVLETQVLVTIIVALIGWPLAVDNIFLQINNSLKRKLEADTIKQIDDALTGITASFATTVTFNSSFVVKPLKVPKDLWSKSAEKRYWEIADSTKEMRNAYGGLYRALEANEIVIIHLEQYYRYLTIKIGDFIDHVDKLSGDFLIATTDFHLSEKKYNEEVAKFEPLKKEWSEIATYSMDFRKMIQNELLGDVFKRELKPRQPLLGHGTTLEKLATKLEVQRLIDERNEKIGLPKGLA